MERTVFITGKSLSISNSLSTAARATGRNVVITNSTKINPLLQESVISKDNTGKKTSENEEQTEKAKETNHARKSAEIYWNRSSASGTRAVLMESERYFKRIDEAILVFDSIAFHNHYQDISPMGCTKAIDDLISGYLFMTCELLQRFKREKSGTLVFVLKEKKSDMLNIPLAMAQAAFTGLAEETANSSLSLPWDVLLVKVEEGEDAEIASWIFSLIDDPSKKTGTRWLKSLSKGGLFGRF